MKSIQLFVLVILLNIVFFSTYAQEPFENIIVNESGISISGKTFELPVKINTLTMALGVPDSVIEKGETVNFYWNKLGIRGIGTDKTEVNRIKIILRCISSANTYSKTVVVNSNEISANTHLKDLANFGFIVTPDPLKDRYYEFDTQNSYLIAEINNKDSIIEQLEIARKGLYGSILTNFLWKNVPWDSNEEYIKSTFRKEYKSNLRTRKVASIYDEHLDFPELYTSVRFWYSIFGSRFGVAFYFDKSQKVLKTIELGRGTELEKKESILLYKQIIEELRKSLGMEHFSSNYIQGESHFFRVGWCFENTFVKFIAKIDKGFYRFNIYFEQAKYSPNVYKLREYCISGDKERVEKLLGYDEGLLNYKFELGRDGDSKLRAKVKESDLRFTPIMFAAYYGHTSLVKLLYSNKAELNFKNEVNALTMAMEKENFNVVEFFLENEMSSYDLYSLESYYSEVKRNSNRKRPKRDSKDYLNHLSYLENKIQNVQISNILKLKQEFSSHITKGDITLNGKLEIDTKFRRNHPELFSDTVYLIPLTQQVKIWLNKRYSKRFRKSDFNDPIGDQIKSFAYKTHIKNNSTFQFEKIPKGEYFAITFINYIDSIQHTKGEWQNVYKKRIPTLKLDPGVYLYDEKEITEEEFYEEAGKGIFSSETIKSLDDDKNATIKMNGIEYTRTKDYVKVPTHKTAEEKTINFHSNLELIEGTTIADIILAKDGNSTKKAMNPNEEIEKTFYIVEEMPKFNEGEPAITFNKWIKENLKYPDTAKQKSISGTVVVQFRVNSEGVIKDVKVIRGVESALDAEAKRLIESSPVWTPGKQRGKNVSVLFTFSVKFTPL